MSLNRCILIGRLVKDAELRHTQTGKVIALFDLAVERNYAYVGAEKQVDYIKCLAWEKTGVFIEKYFKKGNMICVEGALEMRKYQDNDGKSRTTYEVNVSSAYFCRSRKEQTEDESGGCEQPSGQTAPTPAKKPVDVAWSELEASEDDLPF